jgi:NAD-dependent DNA ligase
MTGALGGTTRANVAAALRAAGAEVRNDNQVRDLDVLIVGARPGGNKLPRARKDGALLIEFNEAQKLPWLAHLQ